MIEAQIETTILTTITRTFQRRGLGALAWAVLAAMGLAACGGGSTQSAVATPAACPSSGLTSSAGTINLQGNCAIAGDVNLSGSAALTMTSGILSIQGNVVLSDSSQLTVTGGGLTFPQTNYSQYSVTLNGNSQLILKSSAWVTNGTQQNNFSMTLQANDSSAVDFEGSALDTSSGSWLLGSFGDNSKLTVNNTQNLPTEIYPSSASEISISSGSIFAAVWLSFPSGSNSTLQIPRKDSGGNYNFSFGPGTGIAYSVNISESGGGLGLSSYPDSTLIVNGDGASATNDASVAIGYYVQNSTGPVSIDGLDVGSGITLQLTDQGRNLQLNNVNLGPFSWQIYVSQSNNFPVTVTNSKVNEIAAFSDGLVNISNCTLQLAVTEAGGPGAVMNISGTQIWSQTIQAQDGGQLTITDSELHGNFISAAGAGSSITMTNVDEERNGVSPQSCTPVNGAPPNNDGVPLCNPFNPLYQCSQVLPPADGATITANPALTCPPQ
jgi:hypothetical protein